MKNRTRHSGRRAFTLIELMTIVVLLGVLASMVIPQFTDASDEAAETAVRADLRTVRTQIEHFHSRTGHFPATLEELVKNDMLVGLPRHPGDLSYQYDNVTGEFTSELFPDW